MIVRFRIDGKEYVAPEDWMRRQIRARCILGDDVQQASAAAMEFWAREHEGESRCHANQ